MDNVNTHINRTRLNARIERLSSPETIQTTKAVRHGNSGEIRVAYCKEDSPNDVDISCALDTIGGDTIDVRCNISPYDSGVRLDKASPLLVVNMPIFVMHGNFMYRGSSYTGWMCVTPFNEMVDWG